ncbi:MAG: efflux RND transporter periplasmic adaptor subunit [Ignavibacteria bacterium]|nr:efflux RND transporter periplasmic adaptor subunit [Ignavibacteria bacterium]
MNTRAVQILTASFAVLIVILGIYVLFFSTKGGDDLSQTTKGKRILFYRDPMDPTMTSDKPGKSPMGMDMVPVFEGDEGGGVKIDPTTVQNIGVRYETIEQRTLTKSIRTVGKIDYDEKKLYYVNTKVSGWADKLYVNYTGKLVQKGEPLVAIYSPELVAAEEDYIIALKYRDLNPSQNEQAQLFERAHRKLMFWDIPHDQIVRLETTKKPEKTMTLVAPEAGVVVEKNVLQGGNIMAGANLFKIADLSTVWVMADIYEYEVPFIRIGQGATVSLAYAPGKEYKGRVSYIFPYLNSDTRTVKVRIEIPNPSGELKPAMFATVDLQSPVTIDAIAIPEQSVIHTGERDVVVISRGDGRFESRDVKLGVLAGGYYQVLDGVKEGEQIVVSSQFLLDSESNLKAAMQSMSKSGLAIDSASMKQRLPGTKDEELKMDDKSMKSMKQVQPKQKAIQMRRGMKMDGKKMDMDDMQMDSSSQHKNHSK